jgi:hypothetical protein
MNSTAVINGRNWKRRQINLMLMGSNHYNLLLARRRLIAASAVVIAATIVASTAIRSIHGNID